MKKRLLTMSGHLMSLIFLVVSVWTGRTQAYAFEVGQTLCISRDGLSVMPKNSSLDSGAQAEMWTDAQTSSQRWILQTASSTTCFLVNAYTGKVLAPSTSITAGAAISVLDRASAASRARWELVPVEGREDEYIIYASTTQRYALSTDAAPSDGSTLKLVTVATADSSEFVWKVTACEPMPTSLTPEICDDMMEKWKAHYYHKASTGYVIGNGGWWGDAEMFEVVLDALETTGDKQYATMFENLYVNFISRKTDNWISGSGYNEYNDDIAWMCIACVRAYLMTGVTKYLSTAKSNFDGMYSRAAKYANGTLVWKQGNGGTTSCINGPAAVCACYLGMALGREDYFQKAATIYAGERGLLYNINSQGVFNGQVYDSGDPENGTVGNTWSSTYNQGTSLGAAVMLYEHFGTEQYRSDADAIMNWTAANLANSNGIIKVCQTVNGDLTGFKGILMRYVRRYAASLCHPEWYDWLAKNAFHAWNNRNSKGISMSAWLTKTTEDFYYSDGGSFDNDGVGAFTAVSAAFNAHLGVVDERDAYSLMQSEEFNFLCGTPVVRTGSDEDGTGYAGAMRKGYYVGYRNVDFGSRYASHITLRCQLMRTTSVLNVYLDGPSDTKGTLVCVIKPLSDEERTGWVTVERALDVPVTGKHDVYFVCSGTTGIDLASINWFQFSSRNTLYDDVISPLGIFSTSLDDTRQSLSLLSDADPTTQFTGVMQEGGEAWIQYDAPSPVLLQGYSLFSGFNATADPVGWTLLGSMDGQQWDTLHEVSEVTFEARSHRVKQDLALDRSYQHFRLVLCGKENQTSFYLSEWQLMGHSIASVDITADGGTVSGCEPLIDHQGLTPTVMPDGGVVYRASGSYVLTHYSLTTTDSCNPVAWVLEGSNNGTTWKVVDERQEVIFPYPATTGVFEVSGRDAYIWYRLRMTGTEESHLAQWQMFGNLDMGTVYPDITTLMQVSGPDGSDQSMLVDDQVGTFSTVTGDSLYWVLESPLVVRPLAYSVVAAADREQVPTSVSVCGLADDGTPSTLSTRTLSLNARGSRYTASMATSKSFRRFQLLVNSTVAEEGKAASLTGFELYGTAIVEAGTDVMTLPDSVETSSEGVSASESIDKINDQNRLTGYRTTFQDSVLITFTYAAPVAIDCYSITAGKDNAEYDPAVWELQGSADGVEWVTLDTRSDALFSHRYATQFYRLGQSVSYPRYRLLVSLVNGGTQLQMSEVQLLRLGTGTSLLPVQGGLAAADMQIRAGQVQVDVPQPAVLCVYDMNGRMLDAHRLEAGSSTFPAPSAQGVLLFVLRMPGATLVRKVRQ
ncbi:MAG: glycoside hydrolase family 76 protein [Bacteroidaceae bacterium]